MLKRSQVIVREVEFTKAKRNYKVIKHFSRTIGNDDGNKVIDLLLTMKTFKDRKHEEDNNE
jgi:hypothetical protein